MPDRRRQTVALSDDSRTGWDNDSRKFLLLAMHDIQAAMLLPAAVDDTMPGVLEKKSLTTMTRLWDAETWEAHRSTRRWIAILVKWPHSSSSCAGTAGSSRYLGAYPNHSAIASSTNGRSLSDKHLALLWRRGAYAAAARREVELGLRSVR